jgi:hypothetical protein
MLSQYVDPFLLTPSYKTNNTMKIKTLIACFVSLLLATITYAQKDYAFKVLVNKGKNEVKSGNSWEPVKVGSNLKSNDELKLAENSYVGLVNVEGSPLELKQAGNYKVSKLLEDVGKGSSVLNKYTDFILSSNTQKKNNLAATGAVHRGLDLVDVFLPPSSSYVLGDTVCIVWDKNPRVPGPYIVTITSLFGDELLKTETSGNSITVNLNDGKFADENDVTVKVMPKKDQKEPEGHTLRKYSKNDSEKMKQAFSSAMSESVASKTALNMYYRGLFFEQHKLMADAGTAFQEAIKLAPDVPYYKEEYENFILRQGLKEPPKGK